MIHYMIGKEDKMTMTTKTGCAIKAEDVPRKDAFVFWENRQKVDCGCCQSKIARILTMRGE